MVRWRRVGELLPEGAWSDKAGNLHLPGQVKDSGVYECFTCSGKESISAQTEVTFFCKLSSNVAILPFKNRMPHSPYAMLTVFSLFTTANDAPNQKPIPIYVENGSSVTLNCWHKGASHLYSRVVWFKGDSKPLPSHARVEKDGSLTLTNIRHGAVYRCVIPVRYISCVPTHNTFHIQVIGMTHVYTHVYTHRSMSGQGCQSEKYDTALQQEGQLGHRHRRQGMGDHYQRLRHDEDSRRTHPQEEPRRSSQEYPPNTQQPEPNEQPSAFDDRKTSELYGGVDGDRGVKSPSSGQQPGRTFDEIRAENRKRQQFEAKEYRHPDQRGKRSGEMERPWGRDQRQIANAGNDRPRERRNKYGDIIIEDDDE